MIVAAAETRGAVPSDDFRKLSPTSSVVGAAGAKAVQGSATTLSAVQPLAPAL